MGQITVKVNVKASAKKVWNLWTEAKHIVKWNTASDDWHTTKAENDLRVGGKFLSRMEAKDGSFGFNFMGTYDEIIPQNRITYTLDDGRKVITDFKENNGNVEIITILDAENQNPIDMQRAGWKAILNNFKYYTETN